MKKILQNILFALALVPLLAGASTKTDTAVISWNKESFNAIEKTLHPSQMHHFASFHDHIAEYFVYHHTLFIHPYAACANTYVQSLPFQCINFLIRTLQTFHPRQIIALQSSGVIDKKYAKKQLLKLYAPHAIYYNHHCYPLPNLLKDKPSLPQATIIYTSSFVNRFSQKSYCKNTNILLDSNSLSIILVSHIYKFFGFTRNFPQTSVISVVTDLDDKSAKTARAEYEKDNVAAGKKIAAYTLTTLGIHPTKKP